MKYWTINMWNLMPCPNPEAGGMNEEEYDQYINKLETEDYDAVILFCQTEFEFYRLQRYDDIVDITRKKGIKIYALMGLDHHYIDIPDNLEIVPWTTNFCRETVEQVCHYYHFADRGISSIDDVLIKDLNKLEYDNHYVYLNGKCHEWRSALIDTVAKHDLLKYSAYSWHGNYCGNLPYTFKYYDGSKKVLDQQYDTRKDQGWLPKEYYTSFFQLVPETTLKCHFVTEKTMVPLLVGKPFLVAGSKGFHKRLKSLGFKLYDELFDYSFDDIDNMNQRYDAICEQIKKITALSLDQCREYHKVLQDKITYNRNRVIELAYDWNSIPEIAKMVIKRYDETGVKMDWWLIETELRLRHLRKHLVDQNL